MIAGKFRIILTPTLSQLPFVGGAQFMFLTLPEIDFDFDGAAKIGSKLPTIKNKIKSELLNDMSKEIIFPNRVILPLSWSVDPELVWQRQLSGIIGVKLTSVSGLPKKGVLMTIFVKYFKFIHRRGRSEENVWSG